MSNHTLGERIKYHRKRLGLTQEQLAERMGVSAQAVSKWENNLSCPDISVLPELSVLFGISVDELIGKRTASSDKVHEAEVVENDNKPSVSWEWGLSKKKGSVLFAFYVIMAGGLMLVNHICNFDVSWWTVLWTLGVFYIGVSGLCNGFSVFSLTITLAGAYFLLSSYDLFSFKLSWGIVIPSVLLLWGLSLLIDVFAGKKWRKIKSGKTTVHNNKKLHHEYSCEDGYLHCDVSFGEHRTAVVTALLRGGDINASFGDFTVDFSACEALTPNCTVDVDNSFGSLTLLVPNRFQVNIVDDDGFAAHADIHGFPSAQPQGTLNIKLDNSFGNFAIRYVE